MMGIAHMLRRRNYLLSDTFQYRFVGVSFIYHLVVLLAFAAMLFWPLGISLEDATLSPLQVEEIAKQFLVLHNRIWTPLVVALLLLTLHSVLFSHRIAGPLFRFRTIFKAITKGDLTVRTTIRKNDFLQREAEAFGEMIEWIKARLTEIQSVSSEIKGTLRDLEQAAGRGSDKRTTGTLEELRKRIETLDHALDGFHTTTGQSTEVSAQSRRRAA
jgi:methyl-accepting chemotaxis protein